MAEVAIYNQKGEPTGEKVELNPKIFGVAKIKPEVVHFVVTALQANQRAPIAATKTRGEVRGGGRKPWKQKGTGRARAGSIRSPLWRGGGVTFGPRIERNFRKKVNRKVRRLGFFSVLTDKAKENRLIVVENLELTAGKTQELKSVLKKLPSLENGRKLLLLLPRADAKLERAARNLPNVKVSLANNLNLLDLLWADLLIVFREALSIIEKSYGNTR